MNSKPTILWVCQDLRLQDNPALTAAIHRSGPVIPLYIWSPNEEGAWPPGAASCSWLHHSLESLDRDLRLRGSQLIIREGRSLPILCELVAASGADAVFWNHRYEPKAQCSARDRALEALAAMPGRKEK